MTVRPVQAQLQVQAKEDELARKQACVSNAEAASQIAAQRAGRISELAATIVRLEAAATEAEAARAADAAAAAAAVAEGRARAAAAEALTGELASSRKRVADLEASAAAESSKRSRLEGDVKVRAARAVIVL